MASEARILGIDAGFAALGLVVVEGRRVVYADTIRTERTAKKRGVRVADDDTERCQVLAHAIMVAVARWNPGGVVAELPSGGAQGARANRAMGMATGVVAAACEAEKLPAEWVTPQAVKKAATGRRDGSKQAVQEAVRREFDWGDHWPRYKWAQEHVADAAGAILAARGGVLMRVLGRELVEREEAAG